MQISTYMHWDFDIYNFDSVHLSCSPVPIWYTYAFAILGAVLILMLWHGRFSVENISTEDCCSHIDVMIRVILGGKHFHRGLLSSDDNSMKNPPQRRNSPRKQNYRYLPSTYDRFLHYPVSIFIRVCIIPIMWPLRMVFENWPDRHMLWR